MQMHERDEKKRSLMWKVVMTVSTLVIVLVSVYFVGNIFTGNPIEGTWVSDEKGYIVEFDSEEQISVKGVFDGQEMEYKLRYTINKADKLVTIKANAEEYGYVSSAWTTEETSEAAMTTSVTFSYSLGRKTLTLTDRDYGEEFVFTRQ